MQPPPTPGARETRSPVLPGKLNGLLNPGAANDAVSVIKDGCLPRSNRRLRLVKLNPNLTTSQRGDRCSGIRRSIPDLDRGAYRPIRRSNRYPVDSVGDQSFPQQLFFLPDDQLI